MLDHPGFESWIYGLGQVINLLFHNIVIIVSILQD